MSPKRHPITAPSRDQPGWYCCTRPDCKYKIWFANPCVGVHCARCSLTDGDLAIALRKNGEIYPVSAISRGEVALLQYALQYAVARLAGVGVLIFDHAENIDEDRRGKFKGLVARCLKDGAQVLLLSCAKPTAKAPKGTACYTVVDGTVVEVEP